MAIVHSLLVCFCWTFAFCIFNHYCLFYWRSAVKESDERFGSNLWTVMKRAKENSLLCVCRKDNRCGAHRRFNYDWFFFSPHFWRLGCDRKKMVVEWNRSCPERVATLMFIHFSRERKTAQLKVLGHVWQHRVIVHCSDRGISHLPYKNIPQSD